METPRALITGSSRGVGATTAVALAERGFDVAITYREKRPRAEKVAEAVRAVGREAVVIGGDITVPEEREALFDQLTNWTPGLQALVLNASGGLEQSRVAADPNYPTRINHDAQVGVLEASIPFLAAGSTVAFITSHWAHLYGQIDQLPHYGPVAESKHKGELAMRERQEYLGELGIRLLVVTGDLVDGTITAKLLERKQPGVMDARRDEMGVLIDTQDMAVAIANAIINPDLPNGHTVVVGAPLESMR